jgi:hypothetical protein
MRAIAPAPLAVILAAWVSATATAQTGAPPGAAAQPVPDAPNLPDTSAPPAPKPNQARIIKDAVLPGLDGSAPRPKPNVTRSTGDEDEMDDLDVQRRTAPSDQGDQPLKNPITSLPNKAPILAPAFGKKPAGGAGNVARTTGDEDEMDDLDVQRRSAPSDQGSQPLPGLKAPLIKGRPSFGTMPNNLGAAPALRLGSTVYQSDQRIEIEYSGMPAQGRDWLTIVPVGTPDEQYGEWTWLHGKSAGSYRSSRPYAPGKYEVRAYEDWPAGKYAVKVRSSFEVR